MNTGYSVADAMTTKPVTIQSTLSIRNASDVMKQHDIGSLLVVDDDKLVGIITTEDIVHRVTAAAKPSAETVVADAMTRTVVSVHPELDIYDAVVRMKEHNIYHLPVLDGQGVLVGFLTLKDILAIEPQLFEIMSELSAIGGKQRPQPSKAREGYCQECGNYSEELAHVNSKWLCQYCSEE